MTTYSDIRFTMAWAGADGLVVTEDGACHHVGDDSDPSAIRGYGGRKWVIRWLDGTVTETRNLWHVGYVPDALRGWFPVNAVIDTAPFKQVLENDDWQDDGLVHVVD